jgi:hypothetical protein
MQPDFPHGLPGRAGSVATRNRYRGGNSIVVSRRRWVRKPRTYLSDPGVEYFFAYARFDGVADACAACADRTYPNLPLARLDRAEPILEERSIPAASRLRPRTRKHTAVYDDGPDPDEAMGGSIARANSEDLALVDRGYDGT